MAKNCCICLNKIFEEDGPILTMGAYGTPKCLCSECAEQIETATSGTDYDKIVEAMDSIPEKLTQANVDDKVTVTTVTEMFADCAKRAQEIKNGTWDFSKDNEASDESFDEIPEELKETEEDRLLDEADAKSMRKFDKVMSWVWAAVLAGVIGFLIWRLSF